LRNRIILSTLLILPQRATLGSIRPSVAN
jgi:hypothetical protein